MACLTSLLQVTLILLSEFRKGEQRRMGRPLCLINELPSDMDMHSFLGGFFVVVCIASLKIGVKAYCVTIAT